MPEMSGDGEQAVKGAAVPPEGQQIRIKWDDANMRSVYANVCNVAGGREEVVLMFGMNQAWNAAQREVTVQLSERIVLNPYAAKRLALLLTNVVRSYESQFGTLDLQARPQSESVAR